MSIPTHVRFRLVPLLRLRPLVVVLAILDRSLRFSARTSPPIDWRERENHESHEHGLRRALQIGIVSRDYQQRHAGENIRADDSLHVSERRTERTASRRERNSDDIFVCCDPSLPRSSVDRRGTFSVRVILRRLTTIIFSVVAHDANATNAHAFICCQAVLVRFSRHIVLP
jgi:hypothetical protein